MSLTFIMTSPVAPGVTPTWMISVSPTLMLVTFNSISESHFGTVIVMLVVMLVPFSSVYVIVALYVPGVALVKLILAVPFTISAVKLVPLILTVALPVVFSGTFISMLDEFPVVFTSMISLVTLNIFVIVLFL